mmetsp:Transcript_8021/g.14706  ORF Transcript_8021/g.14706 Transcript_8021/m.14706 type:complete len:880 (+) Transcript_8021:96-2735(+)
MGLAHSCRNVSIACGSCAHICNEAGDCCVDLDGERGGMVGVQAVSVMLDWCPGSDPMGAIFEETLEYLGILERHLMLFCASSNLLAVRWLLHLGAKWDARDTNGSSCLHVACRAGSLQIVRELLTHELLLEATDVASWTPLHIAAHMGRREAVVRLLQAHADPQARGRSGQTPADLCTDSSTKEALRAALCPREESEPVPEENHKWAANCNFKEQDSVGAPLECEHIPFFLPPVPAVRARQCQKELWRIAVLIFNWQPSHGLAFTVAVGLSSTYAEALMKLLQNNDVNRAQVGGFLGEALSLSFLIRLSLFDSLPLAGTGVISALRTVFKIFQLPSDFQKIDRLLHGVAQVWWRKHSSHPRLQTQEPELNDTNAAIGHLMCSDLNASPSTVVDCDSPSPPARTPAERSPGPAGSPPPSSRRHERGDPGTPETPGSSDRVQEVVGSLLKNSLSSLDGLYQLMFSTVLLHWHVHGCGPATRRDPTHVFSPKADLSYATWSTLNRGLGPEGADIRESVQRPIHQAVCQSFIPEFALAPSPGDTVIPGSLPGAGAAGGGPDEGAGLPEGHSRWDSALSPVSTLEGWMQHRPWGVQAVRQGMQACNFSEVPASAANAASALGSATALADSVNWTSARASRTRSRSHNGDDYDTEPWLEALFETPRTQSRVWVSLCGTLLFFAAGPALERGDVPRLESGPPTPAAMASGGQAATGPYMFLDATQARISQVMGATRTISLVGAPEPPAPVHLFASRGASPSPGSPSTADGAAGRAGSEPDNTMPSRASTSPLPPASSLPNTATSSRTVQTARESTWVADAALYQLEADPPLTVVHFLPDGRWQELRVAHMDLCLGSSAEVDDWLVALARVAGRPSPSTRGGGAFEV